MPSRLFRRFNVQARALVVERRGAIVPMLAIVLVLIIVIAGAGIDFARAINQRQAIARGLDAAMLAVARELSTRNMSETEIQDYLKKNYEAYFGANAEGSAIPGVEIVVDMPSIDTKARRIAVSARSEVPTYFIRLAGMGPKTIPVSSGAQAIYPKSVEAALVVDVTGSMAGTKIAGLREAAAGFVNTLIPPASVSTNEKVRVALVPYSAGVNIGATLAAEATGGASKSRTSYPYCVSERDGAQAYTDASHMVAPIGPGAQQAGYMTAFYRQGSKIRSSPGYVCPTAVAVPLTLDPGSTKKPGTLLYEVARLGAGGNTAGQTGIAWGWYMLSSNWSSLWPSKSAPAPASDERVVKYLVVMTDGDFNTWFSPDRVGRVNYDWIAQQGSESATRARALCTAIKAKGITIITVGFQIAKGSAADKVMSDCASGSDNYYRADSDEDLIAEFARIANQIKSTYLSR
jgi:Flp pilus assembly protein TadG